MLNESACHFFVLLVTLRTWLLFCATYIFATIRGCCCSKIKHHEVVGRGAAVGREE